ncbi:MAG: VWA domain-containing protein, partial [Propionibacteriaceae bacterium]|nr:VWA domain-containing protein [Propionibacteriaceae bacterium]
MTPYFDCFLLVPRTYLCFAALFLFIWNPINHKCDYWEVFPKMRKVRAGIAGVAAAAMVLSALMFSPLAQADPTVYEPVANLENWRTTTQATNDDGIILTKKVTARTAADTWDIELSALTPDDTKISSRPVQLALVLDVSGSMTSGGSTKLANLKKALTDDNGLLDQIAELGTVHVSVTVFSSAPSTPNHAAVVWDMTLTPLGSNATELVNIKNAINARGIGNLDNGSTNVQTGINRANSTFVTGLGEKVMIVMTDGEANQYLNSAGQVISNVTAAFSAAIDAANAAKSGGVIIHTVGFDITQGSSAWQLLQDIKSSGTAGTYAHVPNQGGTPQQIVDALRDAFFAVVKISTAMIIDPIADGFELVGNPVANIPSAYAYANAVMWNAPAGTLEPKTLITITYTIKLKDVPAVGIYNNVPTNGTAQTPAQFNYRLTDAPISQDSTQLNFPVPTVRYTTGRLDAIVELVDASGVVVDRQDFDSSPVVYTDFNFATAGKFPNDVTIDRAPDPLAASAGYAYFFNKTYDDVLQPDTTLYDGASADDLVAKAGLTTFSAKIAQGINTVVYQYRVVGPINTGLLMIKEASSTTVPTVPTVVTY